MIKDKRDGYSLEVLFNRVSDMDTDLSGETKVEQYLIHFHI